MESWVATHAQSEFNQKDYKQKKKSQTLLGFYYSTLKRYILESLLKNNLVQ